ncbi:sensor histidine kinase [Luteimonas saliphila]|uniref:sensor histidine kinase n=1 Tax=Luteimonas saliphila TaxID=2804919 RepID=UPI00192E0FC6|nr:ATP-binding protein [Luteimonas saliphila]
MSRVTHWLQVPAIADPVDRRNAPMLQLILLALGTLPPALWLYRIFGTQIPWRAGETVSLSASLLISGIALWSVVLIRRGRFQWAIRQLMVLVAIILVVSYALSGLGAHMFEMPVQVLWLFVAGMMIGRKALWGMYGAVVLALMFGAGADVMNEVMQARHAFGDAVIRSVMFLLIALVIDRSVAALRESLEEAMAHGSELERANAQLRGEIGARERAQAQLLHAQKMEAVGRMAGGLAHDFGHLLTLVNGYAANALQAASPEDRAAALEGVRSAATRASAQVRKLLHFARRDIALAETFDAAATLREIEPMLRQTLGAAVRFELQLPGSPAPIRFDREQFVLVLLNLAANAADAMPEGGRFSVTARVVDVAALEIAVADDGSGIPEPLRDCIFEPFFTTKPEGHGTGLGLAVGRDLVEAAGGSLILDPAGRGTGAVFRIRLPLDGGESSPGT